MTPELYAGVVLTIIGYTLLFLTGINGIRHARLIGLGIDGYAMSSIWLWIAFAGSLNLIRVVGLINAYGMPSALLFESGHSEPYGLGLRNWLMLSVGLLICFGVCFRSFVMVRNAQRQSAEERKAAAELHKASLSLKALIKDA